MIKILNAIPDTFGDLVKKRFDRAGFDTVLVADGRSLLEALERDRFDAVIFPYLMNYFNGLEVLDRINSLGLGEDLFTVMTSHIHTPQLISNAHELGLNSFFGSPVDLEQIVRCIEYGAKK